MSEFEQELKQAFERRPAPQGLKRRVLAEARKRREAGRRSQILWWQRIAAGVVLAAVAVGGLAWRQAEDRRKGEEAREKVLTALRITGRALNEMNARLTRDRGE